MTTKAQLYLNEQTTKRSFEEELAAKDREIAALREEAAYLTPPSRFVSDAVEAMRAKCEALCDEKNAAMMAGDKYQHGYWDACNDIKAAIVALKAK